MAICQTLLTVVVVAGFLFFNPFGEKSSNTAKKTEVLQQCFITDCEVVSNALIDFLDLFLQKVGNQPEGIT